MSPEDAAPEFESLNEDDLAQIEGEGEGSSSRSALLAKLWFYHPLILLGISLLAAGYAWWIWPESARVEPLALDEAYSKGREALGKATNPDNPLSGAPLLREVRRSSVFFQEMLQEHQQKLPNRPDLVNPYMLYAEAARLHTQYIPADAAEKSRDAVWAYTKALEWEERDWEDEEERAAYNQQFSSSGTTVPSEAELLIRRQRRKDYLHYWRSVMLLKGGRTTLAYEELDALRQEFRRRLLRKTELDDGSGTGVLGVSESNWDRFPPKAFELVAEDQLRLHYYLGMALEKQGETEGAMREYNTFLLQAPRSLERFDALMRLGQIHASRGHEAALTANLQQGAASDALLRRIEDSYQAAADKFSQIIDASAPDDILREAYFRNGMAYLELARNTAVVRRTWWDFMGEQGQGLRKNLEDFVRSGRPLPDRTRYLPAAVGHMLSETGTDLPNPILSPLESVLGAGLTLAVRPRQTQRAKRDELLQKARDFFVSSQGGEQGRFDAAANAMIARTLLAQGRYDEARNLFRTTRASFGGDDVLLACRLGEAQTYLAAGDLDRARRRLLGGLEKDTPSGFVEEEIHWRDFCARLSEEGPAGTPGPSQRVRELLTPEARSTIRHIAQMFDFDQSHKKRILSGLNQILRRRDFYREEDFGDLVLPENANRLLARERSTLLPEEVEWMNRLILETAYPHELVIGPRGTAFEPMPPGDQLPEGLLVQEETITSDLLTLLRGYRDQAESTARELDRFIRETGAHTGTIPPAVRNTIVHERRAIENALTVGEFLFDHYTPNAPEVLADMAQLYDRLAIVVGGYPFFDRKRATELVAVAARTHLRVGRSSEPGSPREEEALWLASWAFYTAGQQGRAIETMVSYLDRHASSDRAGTIRNLLGRAYRDVGRYDDAIRIFRDNATRNPTGNYTSDIYKSLFHLGWVYAQAETSTGPDGEPVDLLGDPQEPVAQVDPEGVLRIQTALQAFNRLRRLPGLGWNSRPYRWATFALGPLWYRIAERSRMQSTETQDDTVATRPVWTEQYRHAESVLQESLDRYQLKESPDDPFGIDRQEEPEDFGETIAARFVSEYYLALARQELAVLEERPERYLQARESLRNLIDPDLYPDILFDPNTPSPQYVRWAAHWGDTTVDRPLDRPIQQVRLGLGESEGPEYAPRRLANLRRNAFFLLAQNYFDEGDRLQTRADSLTREARPGEAEEARIMARDAYRASFAVYQSAYDRLPPRDAPQIMYLMGECLRKLGDETRAIDRYRVAMSSARNLIENAADDQRFLGPDFWEQLASQRVRELEDRITP